MVKFFSINDNKSQTKLFDNYSDFACLYYKLLVSTKIKDLKAYKYIEAIKDYKVVVNV